MSDSRDVAHLYDEMKANAVVMLRYTLANQYEDAIAFPKTLSKSEVISMACALAGIAADFIEAMFDDVPDEELNTYFLNYLTAAYPNDSLES